MFRTRLLSGILLMVIALVTLIRGGNLLFFVLLIISLIGMTELYKVFGSKRNRRDDRLYRCGCILRASLF